MTHTLISLISIFIGLLSANIFASFYKKFSLGFIANTICGVYGSIFLVKFFGKLGFSPEFVVVNGEYFILPLILNCIMSAVGGISIFLFVSLLKEQVTKRNKELNDVSVDITEGNIVKVKREDSNEQDNINKGIIRYFKILSWVEWSSYIILIVLSINKRYFDGDPSYVRYFGRAHGFLFVSYVLFATYLWIRLKWSFANYFLVNLMSLLPFGVFILNRYTDKK